MSGHQTYIYFQHTNEDKKPYVINIGVIDIKMPNMQLHEKEGALVFLFIYFILFSWLHQILISDTFFAWKILLLICLIQVVCALNFT